jgi:hypothetical protein
MSTNRPHGRARNTRTPANDNRGKKRRVYVRIPGDLPITQAEIEVVSALLDDVIHDVIHSAANDNEGPEDDKTGSGVCASFDHASGGE